MRILPKIAGFALVVLLLIARITHAIAADPPAITGPDMGAAGESITYAVINPHAEKLQMYSGGGIWIRAIVADKDVSCTLNDQGTMVEIGCDGAFKVTISSDFEQQLQLVLGGLSKSVIVHGEKPAIDVSQIHISNAAIAPVSPVPGINAGKIPTVTNVLAGDTSRYLLIATNVTTSLTDTYTITLTIPVGIVSLGPRDCVLTNAPGVYDCAMGADSHDWLPSSFNVQWAKLGIYTMSARAFRAGKEAGYHEYIANVLIVEHFRTRQFLPTIKR